ncbi:MAG: hypothetical protein VXX85_06235 [Candidatus Margulisiibacteriota bacterium]|nr:hypothetical protein [Candidatus Margulisiibacteriota bacterium]
MINPEVSKIITQLVNKEINKKQAIAMLKLQSLGVQSTKELFEIISENFNSIDKDLGAFIEQFSEAIHETSNLDGLRSSDDNVFSRLNLSAASDECRSSSFERKDSLRPESPDISLDSRTTTETVSDGEYISDFHLNILDKCKGLYSQHLEAINSFIETKSDIVQKFDQIFFKLEECKNEGVLTDHKSNESIPRTLTALFEVAALSEIIVSEVSETDRNRFISSFTNLKVEKGFTFNAKTSDELIDFIIKPLFESFDKAIEDCNEFIFFNSAFGSDPCLNARVSTILNYFSKINDIPEDLTLGAVENTQLTSQLFQEISDIVEREKVSSDQFTEFFEKNKAGLLAPYCGEYSENVIENSFDNALATYKLFFKDSI